MLTRAADLQTMHRRAPTRSRDSETGSIDASDLSWHVRLLGGFAVTRGHAPVGLSTSDARVVAYLALHDGQCLRRELAGVLWPEGSDERAGSNLRTTLWRLQRHARGLVASHDGWLRLATNLRLDIDDPVRFASLELLPDWSDVWVTVERERIRQRCLHAAERGVADLLDRRDYAEALDLALQLVAADPFRESAHRLVIAIHLAEGNTCEAKRHFATYSRMLVEELGISPDDLLRHMAVEGASVS